jgi:hypothetical protein
MKFLLLFLSVFGVSIFLEVAAAPDEAYSDLRSQFEVSCCFDLNFGLVFCWLLVAFFLLSFMAFVF